MVYCAQALLMYNTVNRRDTIMGNIQTQVANKPRYHGLAADINGITSKSGSPAILIEIRFLNAQDMLDLQAFIETGAVGANQPLPGSFAKIHNCNHDESNIQLCSVSTIRTW